MDKASFISLAPELVDLIIFFVPVTSDLASLALVTHQLHDITVPHLYSTVPQGAVQAKIRDRSLDIRRFSLFAQAIRDKPALGEYVRRLAFYDEDWLFDFEDSDVSDEDSFAVSKDQESITTLFVALLEFLPRLELLEIRPPYHDNIFFQAFSASPPSPAVFSLRHLKLYQCDVEDGFRLKDVIRCFAPPSLESLKISQVWTVSDNINEDDEHSLAEAAKSLAHHPSLSWNLTKQTLVPNNLKLCSSFHAHCRVSHATSTWFHWTRRPFTPVFLVHGTRSRTWRWVLKGSLGNTTLVRLRSTRLWHTSTSLRLCLMLGSSRLSMEYEGRCRLNIGEFCWRWEASDMQPQVYHLFLLCFVSVTHWKPWYKYGVQRIVKCKRVVSTTVQKWRHHRPIVDTISHSHL